MKTGQVKKSLLGLVLGTAMLLLTVPGIACAEDTPPSVDLGMIVKSASGSYSFPEATVTGDVKTLTVSVSVSGKIEGISGETLKDNADTCVMFTFTDEPDGSDTPDGSGTSGGSDTSGETNSTGEDDTPEEPQTAAEQAQNKLRSLSFSGCNSLSKIEVTADANATNLPTTVTTLAKIGDHYVTYVPTKLSWSKAYNEAKTYTFNGMKGYLASLASTDEYTALYNKVSTKPGWLGGTLMVYNNADKTKINDEASLAQVAETFTYKNKYPDTRKEYAVADYYWACGPAAGQSFNGDISNSETEPNACHHKTEERWTGLENALRMTYYECCLVANYENKQMVNDLVEPGEIYDTSVSGYFLAFGGYAEGKDPGEPDANLTASDSHSFTHVHTPVYSVSSDGTQVMAKCSNEDGLCDLSADGLPLTLESEDERYQGPINVLGSSKERKAWEALGFVLPTNITIAYSKTKDGAYTTVGEASNAGYYQVEVKVGNETAKSSFCITKRQMNAFITNPNHFVTGKTYDGSADLPIGPSEDWGFSELVKGDQLTVTADGKLDNVGVGTQYVTITNIQISGEDSDNYEIIGTAYGHATITAREAELAWGNTELEYTGAAQSPTCTIANAVAGDDIGLNVTGSGINVGTYSASASLTGTAASNYKLPEQHTTTFAITKISIAPQVSIKGWTYGETANSPSVTEASNPGKGAVTYEYSRQGEEQWSADVPTETGTYIVKASVAETDNYKSGTGTADFAITPASIATASVAAPAQTYTGLELTPEPTVTLGGKTLVAGTDYTVLYSKNINAGTATITVTGKGNYGGTATGTFEIKKTDIAPVVSLEGWTYGTRAHTPSVEVDSNPGKGKATYEYSKQGKDTWSTTVPTEAGDYTVKATVAETANYHSGTGTADFTIAPTSLAAASVTASAQTYTGSGLEPEPTVTLGAKTLTAGTDYTVSYSENVNAGTAAITVTGKGNYEGTATGTFEIKKAAIAPRVSIADWAYGDAANEPTVVEGTNPGAGAVSYEYSKKGKKSWSAEVPSEVGDYTVKATIAETANYLGGTATADFAITKASITPVVSIEGWTYGEDAKAPVLADGSNPGGGKVTFEYSKKGEGKWSEDAPINAGDYTVKVTIAAAGNYKGGSATADFTVAGKSIKNAKVVLGPSLTANDQEQEQIVESVTLADGTELTAADFTVSGNKVTAVGDYTLTVTGAGNYADSVDVAFTVAPNPDQVAADVAAEKIEAIGKVEYTEESESAIKDAREAYDELTDVQKKHVSDDALKTLENAEAAYQKLDDEVKAAAEAIDAIGDVSYDERSKDAIDSARAAYDALDENQKKRFDTQALAKLESAEAAYKQAAQEAADKEAEEKAKREEEEKAKREAEEREAAEKEAAKKAEQDKAKKNGSKKEKLVGTGDNSAAVVAVAAIAGISLAAVGIAIRRRS